MALLVYPLGLSSLFIPVGADPCKNARPIVESWTLTPLPSSGRKEPRKNYNLEGDSGSGASTYDLINVVIPADQDILIVEQGFVPTVTSTSVTLDPAGLNLSLSPIANSVTSSATSTGRGVRGWYLLNPPAGTYTVRGIISGVVLQTLSASTWDQVDTTAPFGTPVSDSGTTGTIGSLSTGNVPCFITMLGLRSTTAPVPGTVQKLVSGHQSSTNQQWYLSKQTTGAEARWTWTTSDEWALLGFELVGALALSVVNATAALSATSTLTAAVTREQFATATLSATSTLTATAVVTKQATATLSATSTLTAAAVLEKPATATLSSTATLTATADVTKQATAALSSTATLTANANTTVNATAALSATATLTATATLERFATAALSSTATLTATAVVSKVATAALSSTATLTASAVVTKNSTAALSSTATLTITALRETFVTVSLSSTATLTATTSTSVNATAALTATVTLTVSTITITRFGIIALTATATLFADPDITSVNDTGFAGWASAPWGIIVFGGAYTQPGTTTRQVTVSLTSTATLTANPTIARAATATLTSTASLTALGTIASGAVTATLLSIATLTATFSSAIWIEFVVSNGSWSIASVSSNPYIEAPIGTPLYTQNTPSGSTWVEVPVVPKVWS